MPTTSGTDKENSITTSPRHEWTEPGVEEVAPGVHRIPLPLPYDALRAVNVYLIHDEEGPTLVDSGWWLEAGLSQLTRAFDQLGLDTRDLRRVLVTHLHRDHYTLGVHLRSVSGCELAIGRGEQESLMALLAGESVVDNWQPILRRAGAGDYGTSWNEDVVDRSEPLYDLPSRWLHEGENIGAGSYTLDVIETPGHTRGHVSFADTAASLFFAGDHVLPHITPSIGFETRPAHLPLADYLNSLRRVRELPDMRLLPAHGPVTAGTHERVDQLLVHHEDRLLRCHNAIVAGAETAYEVAQRIGWTRRSLPLDELSPMNRVMAIYETAAHVDVLVLQGRLVESHQDGVSHYSALG